MKKYWLSTQFYSVGCVYFSSLRVLEDQVTKGLQTISLWTECAEKSIKKGNLSNWMVKLMLKFITI